MTKNELLTGIMWSEFVQIKQAILLRMKLVWWRRVKWRIV